MCKANRSQIYGNNLIGLLLLWVSSTDSCYTEQVFFEFFVKYQIRMGYWFSLSPLNCQKSHFECDGIESNFIWLNVCVWSSNYGTSFIAKSKSFCSHANIGSIDLNWYLLLRSSFDTKNWFEMWMGSLSVVDVHSYQENIRIFFLRRKLGVNKENCETYRNILFNASARKYSVQFRSQFTFAKQRKYNGIG